MFYATNKKVNVSGKELVREVYRERKGLFGLIKWEEIVKVDSLGNNLFIHVPHLRGVDTVFINGERWEKKAN
jgi:hypothetical protein